MSRKRETAESRVARAAPVFAALGDPTRLRIVARLCDGGPLSITHLSRGAKVTRQAITKHLHMLSKAGLVRDHVRGRERIWELDTGPLEDAHNYLDRISTQWDEAIGRLKAFVEK